MNPIKPWQKADISRLCKEINSDMNKERRKLLEVKIRRELEETLNSMEIRTKILRKLDARARTLTRRLIKVTNSAGIV